MARSNVYHARFGQTLMFLGRPEEGIPHIEKAIRLNPRDPNIARPYAILGNCHLLLGAPSGLHVRVDLRAGRAVGDRRVAALGRDLNNRNSCSLSNASELCRIVNSKRSNGIYPLWRSAVPNFPASWENTGNFGPFGFAEAARGRKIQQQHNTLRGNSRCIRTGNFYA
jgi:hypothetical protein